MGFPGFGRWKNPDVDVFHVGTLDQSRVLNTYSGPTTDSSGVFIVVSKLRFVQYAVIQPAVEAGGALQICDSGTRIFAVHTISGSRISVLALQNSSAALATQPTARVSASMSGNRFIVAAFGRA